MGTFINLGLASLNTRLLEIDILLKEAKKAFEHNETLYNALCRSAQVLLSAHFEGYLKELVRNAIDDINTFSTFKASNPHLKRKFCDYFILNGSDIKKDSSLHNDKTKKMIDVLDSLDTKFIKEFIISTENKNPKASEIDKVAEQFGINKFFNQLTKSSFNLVFSNNKSDNSKLATQTKNYLLAKTKTYPYKVKLDFLSINNSTLISDDLWSAFLSDFLKRRHDIAHGTETGTSVNHAALMEDKIKIQLLIYAFTAFICQKTNPYVP